MKKPASRIGSAAPPAAPAGRRASSFLHDSASYLQALISALTDSAVLFDREGAIVLANEAFSRLARTDVRELVGQSIFRFVPPDQAERRRAEVEEILRSKKPLTVEESTPGHAFLAHLQPVFDTSGEVAGVALVHHNLSRLRQTEETLKERELLYRNIVESANDGVVTLRDTTITYVNPRLLAIGGYRAEDVIGLPILQFIQPQEVAKVLGYVAKRRDNPDSNAKYETALKAKDGRDINVEINASLLGASSAGNEILVIIRDITDRNIAARKLAETNARIQTLLRAMPDVIYFKDAAGRNLEVNKAFEEAVGLPRDQILGWTDDQLFAPARARLYQESDARAFRERRPVRLEETLSSPDGKDLFFETVKIPIMGEDGRPAGLLGVSRNVTEQKRAEKVQTTILHIAQAAISSDSLDTFYRSVHTAIAELMPAKNFYIAVQDDATGYLTFPYFVDEFDRTPAPKPLGRGLTEYVFRTGEPLLATPEIFAEMEVRGEVESIGAPSIDWLGTPLKIQDRTFGVLVVQSYTEGVRYGELERDILRFVSGQVAMAIQRRRTADDILEREQFLSGVLNSLQDGISILDTNLTILRTNRTMEEWYAHALPLVGKKCYQAYHLREERCLVCPTAQTLATHQAAREVVARVGAGGTVSGWLDLYSFPFIDQTTGLMKGVIEYVRDITQQKLAEDKLQASLQEKEVLLREIHHRVKNNLQVIQALISLQARQIKDGSAAELYRESQNRIRSMALVHERLYQSTNLSRIEFAEYLRSLVVHLFHSLLPDTSRIGLVLDVEPLELDISIAIPCGLIVNEMVSNALKHAFPEPRRGEVTVSFHRRPDETLRLSVQDNGQGLPPDFDIRRFETLGMQIIMTLVSQIDGRLDIGRGPGASFSVEFHESGGERQGEQP